MMQNTAGWGFLLWRHPILLIYPWGFPDIFGCLKPQVPAPLAGVFGHGAVYENPRGRDFVPCLVGLALGLLAPGSSAP